MISEATPLAVNWTPQTARAARMSFYSELKRRSVVKVAVAYAAGAWVVAQVADLVLDNFGAPVWIIKAVLVALLVGFPVTLIFSWAYDITSMGVRPDAGTGGQSSSSATTSRVVTRAAAAWLSGVLVLVAAAVMFITNIGGARDLVFRTTVGPISSIAVLPLANLSGDPDQEWLSNGMSEELTAQLGTIRELDVRSSNSARHYRDADKLTTEIAAELGVDALLEGSVLSSGNTVSVRLRLIHGPTDRQIWAESFERKMTDPLALQRDIATRFAKVMKVRINSDSVAAPVREPDPAAYEAYLKGVNHWRNYSGQQTDIVMKFMEQAIEIDPGFALAHAVLAENCLQAPVRSGGFRSWDYCVETAHKAVELDDNLAEAHAALGYAHLMNWKWEDAESSFLHAMALNPNSAFVRRVYSELLMMLARTDEALEQIHRARELDPLNADIRMRTGWPLFVEGKYQEALAVFDDVLSFDPGFAFAHFSKALAYAEIGTADDVFREANLAAEGGLGELPAIEFLRIWGHIKAGNTEEARKRLSTMEQSGAANLLAVWIAKSHILLGQKEEAIAWLEKGYEARALSLPMAFAEHWVDPVLEDPRVQDIKRRMRLP